MCSIGSVDSRRGSSAGSAGWSTDRRLATATRAARLVAVALSAAALSACVQTPFAGQNLASRQMRVETAAEPEQVRPQIAEKPVVQRRRVAAQADRPKADRPKASTRDASTGLASFYRHGNKTASGEKFDATQLTAAHPTLPFGTRLRVTNVNNGQSVTVRVNDRGPFIPGRVVDVSHSAAEALGMTGAGITKVKLDVVE
jgi:rare lipoprotein A